MTNIKNLQTPKRSTVLKALGGLLLVAVVLPFVVFALPSVVGAEHGYVVVSSSMSPTIRAGDAVIVNEVPATAVDEGDVITFIDGKQASIQGGEAGEDLITHRVVEIVRTENGIAFETKGDANEEADRELVPASALVGRVMFSIPSIGYVITFAGTRLGFIALIALPLGLLVLGEIYDLARAVRSERANGTTDAEPEGEK